MEKTVYIQYPDNTIHEVKAYRYAKTNDNKYHFIEYIPSNLNDKPYTVLSIENENFRNDPTIEISKETLTTNCKELDIYLLPTYIPYDDLNNKSSKEELTIEKQSNSSKIITHKFMTYFNDIENKKFYLNRAGYEIAHKNNIIIEGTPKIIENKNCYSTTQEQLNDLIKNTKNSYMWIERQIMLADKKKEYSYLAINICKINNDTFIPLSIYIKYKPKENKKLIKVDNILFIQVNKDELSEIEKNYSNDNTELLFINTEIRRKNKELDDMLKPTNSQSTEIEQKIKRTN